MEEAIYLTWEIIAIGQTATRIGDFEALSGTINFTTGGATTQSVTITATQDAAPSPDRQFIIRISQGDTILEESAIITLGDDDDKGLFSERDSSETGQNDIKIFGDSAAVNDVTGGSGSDTLLGEEEGDTLIGGAGADLLIGGLGADIFVFDARHLATTGDTIQDFEIGVDSLSFAANFGTDEDDFIIKASEDALHAEIYFKQAGEEMIVATIQRATSGIEFEDFILGAVVV